MKTISILLIAMLIIFAAGCNNDNEHMDNDDHMEDGHMNEQMENHEMNSPGHDSIDSSTVRDSVKKAQDLLDESKN